MFDDDMYRPTAEEIAMDYEYLHGYPPDWEEDWDENGEIDEDELVARGGLE